MRNAIEWVHWRESPKAGQECIPKNAGCSFLIKKVNKKKDTFSLKVINYFGWVKDPDYMSMDDLHIILDGGYCSIQQIKDLFEIEDNREITVLFEKCGIPPPKAEWDEVKEVLYTPYFTEEDVNSLGWDLAEAFELDAEIDADRYWIGTTSKKVNNTGNWSTASGGATGASVPGGADDVYYDTNSNANSCDTDISWSIQSLTADGNFTRDFKIKGGFPLTVSGAYSFAGTNTNTIDDVLDVGSLSYTGSDEFENNNSVICSGNFTVTGTWTNSGGSIKLTGDCTWNASITTSSFVVNTANLTITMTTGNTVTVLTSFIIAGSAAQHTTFTGAGNYTFDFDVGITTKTAQYIDVDHMQLGAGDTLTIFNGTDNGNNDVDITFTATTDFVSIGTGDWDDQTIWNDGASGFPTLGNTFTIAVGDVVSVKGSEGFSDGFVSGTLRFDGQADTVVAEMTGNAGCSLTVNPGGLIDTTGIGSTGYSSIVSDTPGSELHVHGNGGLDIGPDMHLTDIHITEFTVNNTEKLTLDGSCTGHGGFTIDNGGEIVDGGYTFSLETGNVVINGTYTSTGTIEFLGEHAVSGTGITFNDVICGSSPGDTLYLNDVNIAGNLTILAGDTVTLDGTNNTVTMTFTNVVAQPEIRGPGTLRFDNNATNFTEVEGNATFDVLFDTATALLVDIDFGGAGSLVQFDRIESDIALTTGGAGVTVTQTGAIDLDNTLAVSGTDEWDLNANTISLANNLTIADNATWTKGGTITVDGNSTFTDNNAGANPKQNLGDTITNGAITLTVGSDIRWDAFTLVANGTIDMATFTINQNGNWDTSAGTAITENTSTLNYEAAGTYKQISGVTGQIYNLTITAGTCTLDTNTAIVTNDVSITGVLKGNAITLDCGNDIAVNAGGELDGDTSTYQFDGNFSNNAAGTITRDTSTLEKTGAGASTIDTGGDQLYDLDITGAGTLTVTGNAINIAHDLDLDAGELTDATNNLGINVGNIADILGTVTCDTATMSFGSGVSTTGESLVVGNGGTFNGGSGAHTMGTFKCLNGGTMTLSSGNTTVDSVRSDIETAFVFDTVPTFDDGNGTLIFTYAGTALFYSSASNPVTFHNVIINNGGNTVQFSNGNGFILTIDNDFSIVAGKFDTEEIVIGTDRDLVIVNDLSVTGELECNSSTINCGNDIIINIAGEIDADTSTIQFDGDFANSGTFTDDLSTLDFTGAGASTIDTGGDQLYDLECSGNGGTLTITGNALDCANDLYISHANATLTDVTNNLGISVSDGTTVGGDLLCGSATMSFTGTGSLSNYAIEIENGGVFQGGSGSHTMQSLSLAQGGNTCTLSSGTTDFNGVRATDICFTIIGTTTFDDGNGTVTFTRAGTQLIYSQDNSAVTFYDVAINNGGNTVQFYNGKGFALTIDNDYSIDDGTFDTEETVSGTDRNLTIGNDFTMLAAGIIDMNGSDVSIAGDWDNSAGGTVTYGTSNVIANSATQIQSIDNGGEDFYNLYSNNSFGVVTLVAGSITTIHNDLEVQQGTCTTTDMFTWGTLTIVGDWNLNGGWVNVIAITGDMQVDGGATLNSGNVPGGAVIRKGLGKLHGRRQKTR